MSCYSPFKNNRGITGKLLTFNQYTYHSSVLGNQEILLERVTLSRMCSQGLSFFDFHFNLLIFKV